VTPRLRKRAISGWKLAENWAKFAGCLGLILGVCVGF
jgi:hypothetical protein